MIMSKDWDKAYSDNQTPWDKGAASPALEEWLQREEGALLGKGLVLGCGLGHDVRLLAKYSKEVEGIDFSKTAISKARTFALLGSESYLCCDYFENNELLVQRYDWAFEHTFFCAIPEARRSDYIKRLIELLKPQAFFLAIFFIQDEGCSKNSEGPPFKIKRETIDTYFSEHFNLIDAYTPKEHYASRPYGSEYLCLMQRK